MPTSRQDKVLVGDYLGTKMFLGILVVKGTEHQWSHEYLHNKLSPSGLAELPHILLQGIHWEQLDLDLSVI